MEVKSYEVSNKSDRKYGILYLVTMQMLIVKSPFGVGTFLNCSADPVVIFHHITI